MQGILYCSISAFKTLFNQAALRAVLKSSIFIDCCRSYLHFAIRCVYASSTLPFIGVSNRFSWSLFGSIPIDYKTLELYYFVFQVYLLLFWHPWVASRALCLYLALDLRIQSKPRKMKRQRTIAIRSMRIRQLTTDSRSFPKLTPSCETMSRLRVWSKLKVIEHFVWRLCKTYYKAW